MEAIHLGSKLLEGQCRPSSSYEVIVCGAEIGTRDPREAVCWGRSYVSVFSITHGSICRVSNFQGSVSGYASQLQTQQEAQAPNRVRPGCCARRDAMTITKVAVRRAQRQSNETGTCPLPRPRRSRSSLSGIRPGPPTA